MTVRTRRVAAVDIGTNSMRLLIVMENGDSWIELGRWERVTGLGRGVDADGVLNDEAIDRTLLALAEFGARMNDAKVSQRRAVATSAARDAANRDSFFDRAELALGVRPEVISGEEEARLAFAGASDDTDKAILVVDIGGGSTELVDANGATSYQIGSVRLTDRLLEERPSPEAKLTEARSMVQETFAAVTPFVGEVRGVAGTWTSLSMMENSPVLSQAALTSWVARLAGMSLQETSLISGLDPARAPVILAGTIIAEGVVKALACAPVTVTNHDLLDGVVAGLLTRT